MRKFSKILTVLLTLALLCGVILSVVTSAAEGESREALNVTKSSKNLYTDFESTDNNGNHYIRFFAGESSSSTSNSFQADYPTVSGNTYARYSSKGNNTLATAEVTAAANIMPDYKINNSSKIVYNMGAYDYAVLDFEIASDKYTFTFTADVSTSYTQGDGDPTVTNATGVTVYKTVETRAEFESYLNGTKQIPQEVVEWTASSVNHKKVYTYTNVKVNDDLKLAYDGDADTYIFPEFRTYRFASSAEGDKGNTGNFRLRTRYDSSAKKWYADTASGARVYLSDEAGVFNHVSYVFETVRTASASATSGYHINNSKVHVFVNGTHVSSNPLFTNQNANETYTIYRLRTNITAAAQNRDGFSICFDNVALNLYGYRGMDYSTKQYEQTGRVYNSDGYGIDEYIDNGDYNKNVDTGAAAKPLWSCEDVLLNKKLVNFDFIDLGGNKIHTEKLLPGLKLDTSAVPDVAVENLFDRATGEVKNVSAWEVNGAQANGFTVPGNVVADSDGKKMLEVTSAVETVATIDTYAVSVVENGVTKLHGTVGDYPKFNDSDFLQKFYDSGNQIPPANVMTDTAATAFKNAIANAPTGATVTLHYPQNFGLDVGTVSFYNVGVQGTLNFDLNGRILVQSYGATNSTNANRYMFMLGGNYKTLNIYSSVPGGKIYQSIYAGGSETKIQARGIVYAGGTKATVNFGDIYNGETKIIDCADDFYIAGGTLVEFKEDYFMYANVNGGTYYQGLRSSEAMFTFTKTQYGATVNINGAKFINTNDQYSIFYDHATNNVKSIVTAKNSEFYCTNDAGTGAYELYGTMREGSTASFENCKIIAKMAVSKSGTITIGEGCEIAGTGWEGATFVIDPIEKTGLSTTVSYPKLYMAASAGSVQQQGAGSSMWFIKPAIWQELSSGWNKDVEWTKETYYSTKLSDIVTDGMGADMSLSTDMALNIYLPQADNIVFTGVTIDGEAIDTRVETVKGDEYYVFSWNSAASNFNSNVATVSFEATYPSKTFNGSADITLDVVRYASLAIAQYGHDTKEADLVTEMMNYKEAVATYLGGYSRNEATDAFYALHDENCTCGVEEIEYSASEVANMGGLAAQGIDAATYSLDEVGEFSMILESANKDLTVEVSYTIGNVKGTIEVCTIVAEYNEDLGAYVVENIPAAYIDNVMTITVNGATGTYCLAAYINSDSVSAEAKVLAEALYKYAMAAESYKHVPAAQ